MVVFLERNQVKKQISAVWFTCAECDEINMRSQADQIPSKLSLAIANNDLYNAFIKLQLKEYTMKKILAYIL